VALMKGTQSVILTFSGNIEAVDSGERRTISGKIAPYNEIGYTSAGKVVFAEGSISAPEPSKIKLLMSHDNSKPVGRMQSITSAKDGLYASFKVSASSRGADAILLAQEQLMDGLSVGVEVTASKPEKDYLLVTAATLREVSLVETAAFAGAAVQKIAAAEGDMPLDAAASTSTKITTTNTVINTTTTETETETESEAAVTTAPESNAPEAVDATEQAAPTVEAARKIILPSALNSQRVRTPITSMATYTEHKIKAALGNDESKLYVTAADDSFTTNPAFNPTQYLSEFVSNTNFDTPTINALSQGVLPNSGMTISVPSLVTSAGGQAGTAPVVTVEAEAGAVQNTGMVTEYLSGTVKKYSGMNTLSVELLERSDPNFYAELTNQLQRAYSLATDAAVIADIVAGGVQGTAVAATSAGIISYVSTESANVYKNTSYFARNYIAGPSQWSLLMGATDSTGRPIYNAAQPMNAGGLSTPTSIRGNVLGLDLYVDHQMVATTIDDSAFIVAPEAMTVYRSPQAYMSVNVVSNLQIQVAIYGFMATIVKMPKGLVRYNLT
jgi:HK97 family phage prohead protease/HK97 family phage major capsid protein